MTKFFHTSLRWSIPALALVLLGQGCLGTSTATKTPEDDGGIYKTSDRAETWVQKRVLLKGAKAVSLGKDEISTIVFDPQDHTAVYVGTTIRGIVTSLNGGDSWEEVTAGPKGGKIQSIAVDAKDKCTVYATMRNKIYKTENCHRDWEEIYFDPKTTKTFTNIVVDWFNPTIVFAGTSEGDIFKSTDGGLSWAVVQRSNSDVTVMLIDPVDSRIVYVGTKGDGIWKTIDGGKTWNNIKNQLKPYQSANRVFGLYIDRAQNSTLYLTSKYGIIGSVDGGETWNDVALTSEASSVEIVDFAVNPKDEKKLAYITKNAIMTSVDKGQTWQAKKLPSTRLATALAIDFEKGDTLYLGFGARPE